VLRGLDDFRVLVQENGVGSMDVAVNDKQILITGPMALGWPRQKRWPWCLVFGRCGCSMKNSNERGRPPLSGNVG